MSAPVTELVDSFGRVHRSMRISITDKCQLRCTYCMPAEGLPWLSRTSLLTPAEIFEIAQAAHAVGFREFRITGGEPLIRREVVEIVAALAALNTPEDPVDISMTTNAVLLPRFAVPLREAGLGRLNVSLDTLNRQRFADLTLRDNLDEVLEGIASAKEAGFAQIKLNTLIMPGINDDEILDLTEFALTNGFELRFIEQMPLGEAAWDASQIITQQQILETLASRYHLGEIPGRGAAPAARWRIDDGPGSVGIIASVTNPFCGDCDRLRLSADGKMRTCLFSDKETDLGPALRGGSREELLRVMADATWQKEAGHLIGKAGYTRPAKGMSQIGG